MGNLRLFSPLSLFLTFFARAARKWKNWLYFLIIAFVILLAANFRFPNRGLQKKLPLGNSNPVISVAATHGLIIAPDGSLWSWGSDFLGWPVLGIASVTNQTTLRRIGNENHWASISAGTSHNLAITKFGTMWGWGENARHQLGDGTTAQFQDHPVPCASGRRLGAERRLYGFPLNRLETKWDAVGVGRQLGGTTRDWDDQ